MIASPHSRAYLDVERSVTGRVWRDRLTEAGRARALYLAQAHGLPDALARVLAGRGVAPDAVAAYLDPSLRALMPDPDTLQDMQAGVARLAAAAERGETVAIFGDYDVDGACSAALLAEFLQAAGCRVLIHIPDRIFEGYGPNNEAITALAGQGARLLVTVDCGTQSHAPLAHAVALGMDAIVIDHHQQGDALPAATAVINPNRHDDLSGLGHLCAAGVVYMTLVALARALRARGFWTTARPAPDLLAALDLVALATVADVVPLVGLNRAFVVKGLVVMRARGRPGLRALCDAAGANGPPRAHQLGFMLGPRINAGGRIGDAALGARLLMMHDAIAATQVAQELNRLNRDRQVIEAATLKAAEAEALGVLGFGDEGAAVIVGGDDWHPGVVGLVASRLKDRAGRPAFAIAFNGATGTGSGRSISGVDLGALVRAGVAAGLLVKGGGHAMAAGLTIERSKLEAFRAFVEARLAAAVHAARADDALLIDGALTARGVEPGFVAALERAGPFGAGAPEPVFVLSAHRIEAVTEVGVGHLRIRAASGDGARVDIMAFRAVGSPLGDAVLAARGALLHLACTLCLDHYNGAERVQARLTDAAAA